MSLQHLAGERPVHFPADPNKFSFDGEVSAIFPDMARRSIPNFYESHEAHARIIIRALDVKAGGPISVLDIGASRGAFLQALKNTVGSTFNYFNITAIDTSPEMCSMLRDDFPQARVYQQDVTSEAFMASPETYDVVCLHYVLQFIPRQHQWDVLTKVMRMVKPGGFLVFGHKESHHGALGAAAHEEYIDFRVANGYTREEIAAKSQALRNSMFPMNHRQIISCLTTGFTEVQETFRFMQFSTVMARK